jgi:hypothetical protein
MTKLLFLREAEVRKATKVELLCAMSIAMVAAGALPYVGISCASAQLLPSVETVAGALAEEREFNLAAQPAGYSIPQFAAQAHLAIVFDAEVVQPFRTRALKGNYDPLRGLSLLLEGSGLEYSISSDQVISLHPTPDPSRIRREHGRISVRTAQPMRASEPRDPNCACGATIDPRHAAEWQHWCMVFGEVSQLRWAPACDEAGGM